MIIRLTKEQQTSLLEWSAKITAAHHAEGVMAPGYTLSIHVSSFGIEAEASVDSYHVLGLGEVVIELE